MTVNRKNGFIASILAIAFILNLRLDTFAESFETIIGTDNGFTCEITDGEACVTGITSTVVESVVIPSTLCGYPVTRIGERAFWQCEDLIFVTIPDSVKHIESDAFGYTSLKSVTIPNGVISIGPGAFWGCDDLKTISIPNSVKYIGSSAFGCCNELTGITIPNSVVQIGSAILDSCYGIKYISIPFLGLEKDDAQTANIGYLFSLTQDFEAVPSGLERVELTNTEYVGDFAFAGCHYIQEILLPDGVKYIGEGAFNSCVAMETLVLPQSVTTIGVEAFKLCDFESINIPSNIKKIGAKAFYRCDELNEFYYCGTEAQWNAVEFGSDNESLTKLDRQGHKWGSWESDDEYIYRLCAFCNAQSAPISKTGASFQYRSRSKKYLVSEEELSEPWILYDAKSGYKHTGMRTTIAAQDDSEEMRAMYSACRHSNMEHVNWYFYTNYVEGVELPNTGFYATEAEFNAMDAVDTVGYRSNGKTYYRYKYCTSINHYTDYYYYMWTDWTNWGDTVYTPDDDTEVEIRKIYAITYNANGGENAPTTQLKGADEECTLSSNVPKNGNLPFLGWATAPNGHIEYQPGDTYIQNASVTLYAIWDTVQSIAIKTLPCKTEYELGEELVLTGLTLTVTYIDGSSEEISEGFAVSGFDSMYAGTQTVWVMYNLSHTSFKVIVNGKNNLTWSIDGDGTLIISGVGEMTNWGVEDSPWYGQSSTIKKVVICDGITSIGSNAFTDCYNLTKVEIPSSVKEICHHAFYACTSLKSITIPDGVRKIDDYSFIICESLESIIIPNSVGTIGADVFHMTNISDIYYGGTQDEWNAITIDESNDDLYNASIHFTNTYKITYNANGGTGAPASSSKGFDEVIKLSDIVPTWENHKFLGWSTSPEGDVEYAPGAEYSDNADITLYAIWHAHIYNNSCDIDCNECGEDRYTSHSYGEWVITLEPTCSSSGSRYKECSLCGDAVTEIISKTNNHSYSVLVIAPTCTAQGYTAHSCNICGDFYYSNIINAHGHKYDNDCDVECSLCGFKRDANHTFDTWAKVDDDTHSRSCTCGEVETQAHNWNDGTVTTQPTHITYGEKTYTCEDCLATKTEQVDKIAEHSYDKWTKVDDGTHNRTCICGDIETTNHNWNDGTVTTQPTHTAYGERTYICEDCLATKTEQVDKIAEHSYGKWTKVDDETHSRTCVCGEVETNTHNWNDGTITIQPTDTTYGEKTYTCIECLATKTEQMDIVLEVTSGVCGKNLTWTLYSDGKLIIDGTGDMYDYKYYNNKCTSPWNAWKSSIKTVIIKDGVTSVGAYAFYWYYESLEKAEIAGTVSSIGNYAFYRCYSLTELTIAEGVTTIGTSAFQQCPFTTMTIPNSVTTISSSAFYYCSKLANIDLGRNIKQIYSSAFSLCPIKNVWCSGSYDDYSECRTFGIGDLSKATWHYDNCFGVYQEKSHTYSEWTNHNEVQHKKSCECGDIVYVDHTWDDGVVTNEPTHKTPGIMTHTCTICNGEKITIIAKQPHEFSKWIYSSETEHTRTCKCDESETEPHNWDSGVITAQPTHTTFGERSFTCNDCSATKTEQIAKTTEHSYGKWTKKDDDSHKRSCACGDIETATHSWDSGVITAQPTHTTFGERTFTCNDCSATKTEQIAKTTEHSFGKWTNVDTSNHSRSCECGDIETSTHNWDNGVITIQPTHTTFGERTFTCNDCSATKTEQIPTLSNIKDSGICGDSLTWVLDNEGTLTISGTGDMYDFQPSEAFRGSEEGLLILPWESYLGLIKNVIIEDGVTNIGESAFCGCDNLVSVVVSGSVTSIGNFAFYSCTNLATIEIPYNVTSIGDLAFYTCAGLTAVEIPDSVTSIGECAFDSCTNLATIEIPNSVTSIGNMAFSSCTNLTSVVIGTGVTSIATCAFESCTALTSIIIPDNVTNIGDNAFYNCTNLTICGYEGSYTQTYAQENSIPFTVIIKHGKCGENLTWTLDIECTLTVSGEGDMTSYSSPPWYSYSQAIKKIVIKNGVTSIDDYAFSYCTYLTSVDIPDSITSIGNYAFEDCNNLTSIIVPDSVKTIGCGAFHLCTSLEEITIPFIGFSRDSEGEYGVFGYIFSYHDEDSDGSLDVGSFCCGAGIEQYREYKQDFYIRYCYHIPKSLKKVTFTGEKIPAGAFKNCYIIDEIELSKSLINIGDEAFYRCSGLTDVYIPESVTSIGDKAFYNCANLTICCSEGSYAQTYAQENSIPYTKSQIEFIGAQIRTDDPQGLRFVFSIPREKYEALSHPQSTNDTGVGFGSVVMPKKYLGDNELTKDTVVTIDGKEYKSKISPAVNLYEITDDEIKYTVCIIGISPTNYTSEYVAVPYMTYIDDTGEEITIYGECTENITVYSIAELAYQDISSSEGVKKYLYNNILSIVDPEKYPTNK